MLRKKSCHIDLCHSVCMSQAVFVYQRGGGRIFLGQHVKFPSFFNSAVSLGCYNHIQCVNLQVTAAKYTIYETAMTTMYKKKHKKLKHFYLTAQILPFTCNQCLYPISRTRAIPCCARPLTVSPATEGRTLHVSCEYTHL